MFYHKDKKVVMYSDDSIQTEKFDSSEVNVTTEELEKIKSNEYDVFVENNKLVFTLNEKGLFNVEESKKKERITNNLNKIKEGSYTKKELFELLSDIIK